MNWERLSLSDGSMIASYAEHIQRYGFALDYCRGKRVLDAGCGTGYGSIFLATNGAKSVLAIDVADDALNEAKQNYSTDSLRFERRDVEAIGDDSALKEQFDVVVNFENLEHLHHPRRFVSGAARVLTKDGILITSTPNGAISVLDEAGNPRNPFHVKEFTAKELDALLRTEFDAPMLYGQWLTFDGMLRKMRASELFEQLCEAYYNPAARLGRLLKRLLGKKVAPAPELRAGADAYTGDYVVRPLEPAAFKWDPTVLIAVCKNKKD